MENKMNKAEINKDKFKKTKPNQTKTKNKLITKEENENEIKKEPKIIDEKLIDRIINPELSEKSVEWNFVKLLIENKIAFSSSMPLAGDPETAAGDSTSKHGDYYHLIEFKRDIKAHLSEHVKFHPENRYLSLDERRRAKGRYFNLAKKSLYNHDGIGRKNRSLFHHIIYSGNSNENILILYLENYWDYTNSLNLKERDKKIKTLKDEKIIEQLIDKATDFGILEAGFVDYIKKFAAFRGFKIDDKGISAKVVAPKDPVNDPSEARKIGLVSSNKDESSKENLLDELNSINSFLSTPVIKKSISQSGGEELVTIAVFTLSEFIYHFQNSPPDGHDGEHKANDIPPSDKDSDGVVLGFNSDYQDAVELEIEEFSEIEVNA